MSAKSLKVFGPLTTKWRPCKIFVKLNGNHLLTANIFKLDQYQTFGLMNMYNMNEIWFASKKFNLVSWNKKYFWWFFKGFHLPEIVLPETAPITILTIKIGLLCNFSKTFKGRNFMDIVAKIWKFQFWIFKTFFAQPFKNMLKIPILGLMERGEYFTFGFIFKKSPF